MLFLNNMNLALFATTLTLCIVLFSNNYVVLAKENEAESISKIGQGVGHIMNIYYWFVLNYSTIALIKKINLNVIIMTFFL